MFDRGHSQILSVLSSPSSLIPIPLASSSEYTSQNIMEESWEHWPLHSELGDVEDLLGQYCKTSADDEEEFLRDIILQQPVTYSGSSLSSSNEMDGSDCSGKKLHPSSTPSTPRTFILSFDKSTIIPATTTTPEESEQEVPRTKSRSNNKRSLEPKAKASNQSGKKSRSGSQCLDHIMAERKRRLELSQKFIALSATIPGLKKMDKNYILGEAISYVKLLQERVKELEDPNKNSKESTIILKKTDMCVSEDTTSNSDQDCCKSPLFDVKARILENEVLIQIHCEKEIDIEIKIYNVLQNLDLFVTASSVLAFGTSTLGFTIVAQMGEGYEMTVIDLVKTLSHVLTSRTEKIAVDTLHKAVTHIKRVITQLEEGKKDDET